MGSHFMLSWNYDMLPLPEQFWLFALLLIRLYIFGFQTNFLNCCVVASIKLKRFCPLSFCLTAYY